MATTAKPNNLLCFVLRNHQLSSFSYPMFANTPIIISKANNMSAEELNRLGLYLGLISGLLLIPEVLNLIPINQMEKVVEKLLAVLENWSSLPQRFHPQSWKQAFSEEGRQKYIEPITAILGLLSSATWIITIGVGIYASSKFFTLLGLILPVYMTIERCVQFLARGLPISRLPAFFLLTLILTLIVAPPISLIRVIILIFRAIVCQPKSYLRATK